MKKTKSAGGVVLNKNGEILVVNQNNDSWSLPKGHIDPGETAIEAAKREILEESGISELTLIRELPAYQRYRIGLNGNNDTTELKTIFMFLFYTAQMKLNPQDPKNPEACWFKKNDVQKILTNQKDKEFFQKISRGI